MRHGAQAGYCKYVLNLDMQRRRVVQVLLVRSVQVHHRDWGLTRDCGFPRCSHYTPWSFTLGARHWVLLTWRCHYRANECSAVGRRSANRERLSQIRWLAVDHNTRVEPLNLLHQERKLNATGLKWYIRDLFTVSLAKIKGGAFLHVDQVVIKFHCTLWLEDYLRWQPFYNRRWTMLPRPVLPHATEISHLPLI